MIKLSRFAQQKLKKKQYVSCVTSFITKEGPAAGTIWWDDIEPKEPPKTVSHVYTPPHKRPTRVVFDDGRSERLKDFLMSVEIGRYVLIGVTPHVISHTEI